MIANTAPIKASSMISPVSEAKITCTPFARVMGCTARTISSRANRISPRPIPTRPSCPARVCLRPRKKITPININNGDSHDRSKVNTLAISAVPTSAPAPSPALASDPLNHGRQMRSPAWWWRYCFAPAQSRQDPRRRRAAFLYAATENGTQASAIDAHHPGTHDMRAPHQQSNRGQQV